MPHVNDGKLIYLASPYNHAEESVREERFKLICGVAAQLMSQGVHLFCPIAHTHPIAVCGDLPRGWQYWREYDLITACDELWIVKIDGWRESEGIKGEIDIAKNLRKPIKYIEVDD